MSAAKVLRDAADLLESKGWCRGVYQNIHGAHCAVGALKSVSEEGSPVYEEAVAALRTKVQYIVEWNDTICQSGEECVKMLREVADSCPPQE